MFFCTNCGSAQEAGGVFCGKCGAALESSPRRFAFRGEGGTLLGILFVNFALAIVTLGIYSFWGRVKVRQFFLENTVFANDRFCYHGTGGELLRGALKAMGLIAVAVGAGVFAGYAIRGTVGDVVMSLIIYGFFFAIAPLAWAGARRYRLSRTSYRNIRFSFRGQTEEAVKLFWTWGLATALTLGLALPVFQNKLARLFYDNTWYGNVKLNYDGEDSGLWRTWIVCWLLLIPTFGMSFLWWSAAFERHQRAHTLLQGVRFESTVTGGGLLGLAVTNLLLVVFTLGIGLPWAQVRAARYLLGNLSLRAGVRLDEVHQQAQAADTTGEGMSLLFDDGGGMFDIAF